MSRIFVATENRLGRTVVVKVLSPELAASVSADRFEREIRFAASLQQANIVPLLATGEMNGMPYYTMPFVEGESLRAENMALLTYAYARSARTKEARHTIARMIDGSGRPLAPSGSLAVAYDALGERALALAALRSAIQQHDPWLTLQGRSPAYAHLRADPVAAGMLARIEAP